MDSTTGNRRDYRRVRVASDLYRVERRSDGVTVGSVFRHAEVIQDALGQRQLTWSWIGTVDVGPGGPRDLEPRDLMEGAIADVIEAVEAAVTDDDVEPVVALEYETDEDGLPTVKGYRQIYLDALALLEAREPDWSVKRREACARGMTEAYCQGAVNRMNLEKEEARCR